MLDGTLRCERMKKSGRDRNQRDIYPSNPCPRGFFVIGYYAAAISSTKVA